MRAVAVMEPDKVTLVELGVPTPGPYQALVKTELAAVCNATDGKLVSGHFPGVQNYPLILGHESAGRVESVGEKVRNLHVGDRVIGGLLFEFSNSGYSTAWGGFCEYVLANDHDAMAADGVADEAHGWFEVYEIQRAVDADIPLAEAVLLCTWREVLGGFGDFGLKAGDDILVFGAGPVGLSFVKFAGILGLGWVGVVEPLEWKRAKALEMGADAVFTPGSEELSQLTRARGKPLDAVIDAVGNANIINAGLPLIKMGGSICVYGVIAAEQLGINKAIGPYNFNLYVHQWPTRWREREAQKTLAEWIRAGTLKASDFVTHEFAVERITDALEAGKRGEVIKTLLRY